MPTLPWAQALAFQLGAQQWEFEAARDAFGDTMRKFAPGGGAGHFLARAIARRSEQVASAAAAVVYPLACQTLFLGTSK